MSVIKRPILSYYGSKWRLARHYAPPLYDRIIEPFAGGAGYSQRWADRDVTLVDLDAVLCGVWDYLIHTPSAEILRLPLLALGETVEDHTWSCAEARHLVGYWLNPASAFPCKALSSWAKSFPGMSSYWCAATREHVARSVEHIRHWTVRCGDYASAADGPATYFVDPPYRGRPGESYRCSSRAIDYEYLGAWCYGLEGQVIVCEAAGADWLPFAPLRSQHGIKGRSVDALCEIGERAGQVNLFEVYHANH